MTTSHINYPQHCSFRAIVWYTGFVIAIVFGLISGIVFGFSVWFMSNDYEYLRDTYPTFLEANYNVINVAVIAVVVFSALFFGTSLTFACSMVSRRTAAAMTLFYGAIFGFASVQLYAAAIVTLTRASRILIEFALLHEAANSTTVPEDKWLLKQANERYGCCGIYNIPEGHGGCDQDYPGDQCFQGSAACRKGCNEELLQNFYPKFQVPLSIFLLFMAPTSSVSFFWRLWSHKEHRKFVMAAIPLALIGFGIVLMILGGSWLSGDWYIIRQYMPMYVEANHGALVFVAASLIVSGAVRVPYAAVLYLDSSTKRHLIPRLFAIFFIIVQLLASFGGLIYFIVALGKPAIEKTLLAEDNANVTNGLLFYASRRFGCCGIYNSEDPLGRCNKTYPGKQCIEGSLNCAHGCFNQAWEDTVAPYWGLCMAYFSLNTAFVTLMVIFVISFWIQKYCKSRDI